MTRPFFHFCLPDGLRHSSRIRQHRRGADGKLPPAVPASRSCFAAGSCAHLYRLPFGNGQRIAGGATGFVNQLVGGWQWNGIFAAQSGFPFTPLVGSNPSGTGDPSQSDVPNWNPDFKGPVILGRPDQWFDPRAFLMPAPGTFGNVARGSLRGPGLVNVDMSLFKKFTISEKLNL